MCGIAGIFHLDGGIARSNDIDTMMDRIRHRGPDDEGRFFAPSLGLGFVRLSIVDLSAAGHQPMTTPDGRHTLVFNGEVYNHREIRGELESRGRRFLSKTDTEVVLQAFSEWGIRSMDRFNGMFAFAVYDNVERNLTLVRDRFGIKPLYYSICRDTLYFASEIKAILPVLPTGSVSVNDLAVFDYLAFERVDHSDATFFGGIRKLQPGHYLTAGKEGCAIRKWYSLSGSLEKGFRDADEYRESFTSAVAYALRGDVPAGISLSGGLDSSSIAAVCARTLERTDMHTFSAVYGAGARGDESRYISELEPFLGNMHYTTPTAATLMDDLRTFVYVHGEPVTRTGPYAQFRVMRLAGAQVKVTLEGQGADEALAGYPNLMGFHFRQMFLQGRWSALLREYLATRRDKAPMTGFTSGMFYLLPMSLKKNQSVAKFPFLKDGFVRENLPRSAVPGLFFEGRSLNEVLRKMVEHKLEHLLKWTDHNSMWFSVESRVPFLDHRLVEKTLATDPDWIVREGKTKFILRRAMQGLVPDAILSRRDKIGFGTPENEWFRSPPFEELIMDILHSGFFRANPYIDSEAAVRTYRRHLAGGSNAARQIWKWINLYFWHEAFIAGGSDRKMPQRAVLVNQGSEVL